MKTISKIAVLALSLALAGALSACGSSASSSASAASASSASASAASETASAAGASASAASTDAASSAAAASESAQAASASDYYKNDYFGIIFNLPEGWTFVDASSIESMNAQLSGLGQGEADMIASANDSSMAVVVTVEEPGESTAGQDAETHLDAAVEKTLESVQGSNVSYVSNGATVEFEGVNREIPAMITKVANDGAELWIGQACAEVDGAYFNISIVAPTEEDINAIFTYFSGAAAQETSAK